MPLIDPCGEQGKLDMRSTSEIASYLPRLRRYSRSLVRDTARADDLVQDTVVRAIEKMHLYRHDTNLGGWLTTIMHNEHVNAARRFLRAPTFVPADGANEAVTSPSQEAPIELGEIRRAIARLPISQREPLLLFWIDGMKYEEVAAEL